MVLARHKEDANTTYWLPRQRHRWVLQGAVEVMFKRPDKSSRCAKGIAGGKEIGTHTRKGTLMSNLMNMSC
jgi:hypothetical protein